MSDDPLALASASASASTSTSASASASTFLRDPESVDLNAFLRDRIIHVLSVYPRISPSMLQVGIGTSFSSKLWRPVLNQLIADGVIHQEDVNMVTPSGRNQLYQVLSLTVPVSID